MRSATLIVAVAVLSSVYACPSDCLAQEFRIETDVFVDGEKEPIVETLTIFVDGVVYDFLRTGVEEISLFDRDRDRLVLMDTQRKVKTELTMESILSFVAEMKARLNDDQRKLFLADGLRATTDDEGWLKLANERVTYRVEGIKPKEKRAVVEYQQFADWYARLNAMRNAMRSGYLPPFFRIRLNAELASRGLIPKTIERVVAHKHGLKETKRTLRSRHLVNWRLSKTDRKLIDRAGTYVATYPTVSFREYVQLPDVAEHPAHNKR